MQEGLCPCNYSHTTLLFIKLINLAVLTKLFFNFVFSESTTPNPSANLARGKYVKLLLLNGCKLSLHMCISTKRLIKLDCGVSGLLYISAVSGLPSNYSDPVFQPIS